MIHSIGSDLETFRSVRLREGLNIVLADRTEESTEHDSRNGLGKTSVVHLIQFCLGGDLPSHLDVDWLQGKRFFMEFDVDDDVLTVERAVSDPGFVTVTVDGDLPEQLRNGPTADLSGRIRVERYQDFLARKWFDLTGESDEKYAPSFRALMSYFARRRHDAYVSPLKHFHSQPAYNQQILLSFLCGMNWRYPRNQRLLHEEREQIRSLKRAAESGVLDSVVGSAGELRANQLQIERRLGRLKEQANQFRVHPQYAALEERADELAMSLRDIADNSARARRLLSNYTEGLDEASGGMSTVDVQRIYSEAEIDVPEMVVNSIEAVKDFHDRLMRERLNYLSDEISRLEQEVQALATAEEELVHERRQVLETLRTHGSLSELRQVESEIRKLELERAQVLERISTRRRIDTGADEIRARRLANQEIARSSFSEENALRDRVVALFDEYWEHLYGRGGRLVIDLTDTGYSFDWKVQREGSEGVGKMKIFAHDLAIATAWAERRRGPGFLVHDSTIWDGVDERQVALALEVAQHASGRADFQYVTMMNSDSLPLEDSRDWNDDVAIRLTDKTDEGRLFGRQF